MIATPSILNPLKLVDTTDINSGFDGNFAVNQLRFGQVRKCYFQKWQTSDTLKLQILADTVPRDLQFINERDTVIATASWSASTKVIIGFPDYVIYELSFSFAALPLGDYYCKFDQFESEPISVRTTHLNTLLLTYKHSENNYDTIFDTGIEFNFRVEGRIGDFKPKNERSTFTDQRYNATQLNSVAWRQFTITIGNAPMVQDWAIDKVNHIMQCNQVAYNGQYYVPLNDSEFEVENNPTNNYIYGTIDVQPVDNNFIKYTTQPVQSGATFTPLQKVTPYFNGAANLTVSNVFKNLSNLEKIAIYKVGGDYIVRIGITPGGNEIGEFQVDDVSTIKTVEWTFTGTQNVYISGTGINYTFLYLIYKQLDEPPVPIGDNTMPPPPIGVGAKVIYEEVNPGDFVLDFNVSTGLGDSNRDWKGWVIAGTNGTIPMENKFPIGWDRLDTITIGTDKGSSTLTIAKTNLPHERLGMFVGDVATGSNVPDAKQPLARARSFGSQSLNYEVAKGAGEPTLGGTEYLGDGTALVNIPDSVISVWVVKIA